MGKKKSLRELAEGQAPEKDMIVAAHVGGEIRSLGEAVHEGEKPVWVMLSSPAGERIYRRSVLFLVIVAMRELYGVADTELMVRASLNGGLYCDLEIPGGVTDGAVSAIEVTFLPIFSSSGRVARRNAFAPIVVRPAGSVRLSRPPQLSKHSSGILA